MEGSFHRNTYMKRLDKPTKRDGDNLLNFQKKPELSLKKLPQGRLSKYLKSQTLFFWLPVFTAEKKIFLKNQIFHVHLKPKRNKITVKGEEI